MHGYNNKLDIPKPMPHWIFEQTSYFKKNFDKLIPSEIQKQFKKQIKKLLTENPYCGKPLGYNFFREKKIKKMENLLFDL